nr:RNA-directed DNA polymerase, eukaryota [Tanacetum cinerariifolium]
MVNGLNSGPILGLAEEFLKIYVLSFLPWGTRNKSLLKVLHEVIKTVKLVPMEDRWVWNLENSGLFTVSSLRKKIDAKRLARVAEATRWIKFVPFKVNVLAWKVMIDALPARLNISRRGIGIPSLSCPICDCGVESTDHLFFRCTLVKQLGHKVLTWWNLPVTEFDSYVAWNSWLSSMRVSSKIKLVLEGVWSVMWWFVWNHRNKILFDVTPPKKSMLFDKKNNECGEEDEDRNEAKDEDGC